MNNIITTNFTDKHESIAEGFLKRITRILSEQKIEIKTYGIDLESYMGETETIKLGLNDNITIQINVVTKRQ